MTALLEVQPLVAVAAARGDGGDEPSAPALSVETITVSSGIAAVTGVVAGASTTGALTIGGRSVPIGSGGSFSAIVRIPDGGCVSLALTSEAHGLVALELPLRAG